MKQGLIVVAFLVAIAVPVACGAAPAQPGPYLSAFVGATFPTKQSVNSTDFVTSRSFSDHVSFDPGINAGGSAGFDFGYLRLEAEVSYKYANIKSITDQSTNVSFGNVDGYLGVLATMFNMFIDLHNDTPVTPYLGGGIGFAALHLNNTYGSGANGVRLLLYQGDDDTVFAYQAAAGIGIALNRQVTLDLGYRYFGTATGSFGSDAPIMTETKFESHNAVAGIRVKF